MSENENPNEGLQDLVNSKLPKIQLPAPRRLLSEFASDLADKLQNSGIYQRGGQPAILDTEKGDSLETVTAQKLRTLVEKYLVCYKVSKTKEKKKTVTFRQTMSESDARGVIVAKQFLEKLPVVDRLATARLPVIRAAGNIELLPDGYDPESRTLTVSQCAYRDDLPIKDAKKVIDDLLSEFVFTDNGRSKAVAISAMVGLFASGILPRKALRPTFVYLANEAGAGKTLLAKCAISPVHGEVIVAGAVKEGEETQKELISALKQAKPYVLFDNCKGHVNSPALEAFTTSAVFGGRLLGTNEIFEGENNITVFLTGNGCTVTGDLRRRCLFAELFLEEERAEDRVIKRYLDDTALLAMRSELLAALWSFVREWDKAGRPKPSRGHGSFERWAQIIGGIVEFAGYGCPLQTAEIEDAGDVEGKDMHELARVLAEAPAVAEKEVFSQEDISATTKREFAKGQRNFDWLVSLAEEHGLFEGVIERTFNGEIAAKTKTVLGRIFKKNDRRILGQVRFRVDGKGRYRMFSAAPARGV